MHGNIETSSTYISGRLFTFISVSSMTSFSSCFMSFVFPVALYKYCVTSPTIFSIGFPIGFCKSTVVARNSLIFFLSISNSSLLVTFRCSGQFLQSPDQSDPSLQTSQSLLSSQPRLPKSGGLFLVGA